LDFELHGLRERVEDLVTNGGLPAPAPQPAQSSAEHGS
jgi:hypothetical protein